MWYRILQEGTFIRERYAKKNVKDFLCLLSPFLFLLYRLVLTRLHFFSLLGFLLFLFLSYVLPSSTSTYFSSFSSFPYSYSSPFFLVWYFILNFLFFFFISYVLSVLLCLPLFLFFFPLFPLPLGQWSFIRGQLFPRGRDLLGKNGNFSNYICPSLNKIMAK